MSKAVYKEFLDAGVHFGHMKRKWNPKMLPYIFMERKGIHIIDLNRTIECMDESCTALKAIAKSGRKRLGGMMTNFSTIKRSLKKMNSIDKMLADTNVTSITKKERLMLTRERNKLEKVLGGIANLNRLPAAIFIVDIHHEHIALAEAQKLGIRTFAMVDTNSNPQLVDFPIPSNDDASKSIKAITDHAVKAIQEGLDERRKMKEQKAEA